jgi:hypothetical protein
MIEPKNGIELINGVIHCSCQTCDCKKEYPLNNLEAKAKKLNYRAKINLCIDNLSKIFYLINQDEKGIILLCAGCIEELFNLSKKHKLKNYLIKKGVILSKKNIRLFLFKKKFQEPKKELKSKRMKIPKRFACPKDYKNCVYFTPDLDKDFHCNKDSNIGVCLIEKKYLECSNCPNKRADSWFCINNANEFKKGTYIHPDLRGNKEKPKFCIRKLIGAEKDA